MFELNLKHKVMNPPIFPKEILVSMPTNRTASAPVSSLVDQPDVELDYEPTRSPQPAQKGKATNVTKKGKSKGASSLRIGKEKVFAVEPDDESNFKVTPSPPPSKKRKTVNAEKKGKKKMSGAESAHYYSSTSEEHTPSPVQAEKVTGEEVMSSDDSNDEVAITKEVHSSVARTLKQMA